MYYKNEQEKIICETIKECKNKTIQQMRELYKIETCKNDKIYNGVVESMINERLQELNYNDGTGSLYL